MSGVCNYRENKEVRCLLKQTSLTALFVFPKREMTCPPGCIISNQLNSISHIQQKYSKQLCRVKSVCAPIRLDIQYVENCDKNIGFIEKKHWESQELPHVCLVESLLLLFGTTGTRSRTCRPDFVRKKKALRLVLFCCNNHNKARLTAVWTGEPAAWHNMSSIWWDQLFLWGL